MSEADKLAAQEGITNRERGTDKVVPLVNTDLGSTPIHQPQKTTASRATGDRLARVHRVEPKSASKNLKKNDAREAASVGAAREYDLDAPSLYLNRELTWLNFNRRVLHEAEDKRTPLLERVKFLAIAASNLDEFFMKRIGGLKQQVGAGVHNLTIDGRSPQQQIAECCSITKELQDRMEVLFNHLVQELRGHDIFVTSFGDLSSKNKEILRGYFIENIFPLLTPLAMDPAHPFPFISNLSLNLLVSLRQPQEEDTILTRVKVPVGLGVPRFLKVPGSNQFLSLAGVVAANLDLVFPGMEVLSCNLFRVIRNANTERNEEQADDLLSMIESELRERKFARIVRLEVKDDMNSVHRGMLAAELKLNEKIDVYESSSLLGMRDLMEVAALDIPELHDPDHHPIDNVRLQDERSIFHVIRDAGMILLHHPYESFATSVERFVREASSDPKVQAIKMVLYRTSEDSRILEYLIDAASRGKQVAVVVELKARFDEAANIRWASRLEEVGIHVTYGVVGLKTHSKTILVVRKDYNGLRRYAHIGTGNYHAGTARLYSDLGLLTCDSAIGSDLTELFNYLTSGCKLSRKYQKILVTPKVLKKELLKKIRREIELTTSESPGLIRLKCNALEDPDITRALYDASRSGVKVELVIRDTCRLRPGLPDLSDNITVISVIGRFLEHTRIFYFRNGGNEEYFIGSADLMSRNLESRVEIAVPIEDRVLQKELRNIFDVQLRDCRSAWDMQADGTYVQRKPARGSKKQGCQEILIKNADKRNANANRLRKRRPKGIASRASVEI